MAARSDYAVISATAAPDYDRVQADGSLRPESYAFSPGRRMGWTRDGSLGEAAFDQVVRTLIPALASRQYWPAVELTEADLLIVVHWGETEVFENPMEELTTDALNRALESFNQTVVEFGIADPGDVNRLRTDQGLASAHRVDAMRQNAELLGYRQALDRAERKYFPGEDERTMKTELVEGRYFVVLMAWDYARLRETKERRLRWVTRMSVRAAGHNFQGAMPALVNQATEYFGRQQDDLVRVRTRFEDPRVEVSIGDSTVIEEGERPGP